jgi:hypothetical protein
MGLHWIYPNIWLHPNVVMSNIMGDHVSHTINGNHVRVSNLFEIISIITLMIKTNL